METHLKTGSAHKRNTKREETTKRRIDLLLTLLGATLLFAGIISYFYYYTEPASEYFNWTTVIYPWRPYAIISIVVALVLLVIGFITSRRTSLEKPEEKADNSESPELRTLLEV